MGTRRIQGVEKGLRKMRNYTPERARYNRRHEQARRDFLDEFNRQCWFCGSTYNVAVHEIASGIGNRKHAFAVRFAWAPACGDCNCDQLTDRSRWPLVRQLGMKLARDPQHMTAGCLEAFNELRGRHPRAITLAEIIPDACRFLDGQERWW